jgi:hypothetical protein
MDGQYQMCSDIDNNGDSMPSCKTPPFVVFEGPGADVVIVWADMT